MSITIIPISILLACLQRFDPSIKMDLLCLVSGAAIALYVVETSSSTRNVEVILPICPWACKDNPYPSESIDDASSCHSEGMHSELHCFGTCRGLLSFESCDASSDGFSSRWWSILSSCLPQSGTFLRTVLFLDETVQRALDEV
jgi:hypothetical protein